MWSEKKIGVRQHHCRSCGKALCEKCSKLRTTIPEQGFEFIPVRCCLGCYESITDSDRIPFATSHQLPTDVSLPTGAITTKSGLLCLRTPDQKTPKQSLDIYPNQFDRLTHFHP